MYQDLYDKAKKLFKVDACMRCYDHISCGHDKVLDNATLHPIAFNRESLFHAEQWYISIECEALGILNIHTEHIDQIM